MVDFHLWLGALGNQLWWIVSGAVLSVLSLIDWLCRKKISEQIASKWWVLLVLGFLCFAWASFLTWDDEYRAWKGEHEKLAAINANPLFVGGIRGFMALSGNSLTPSNYYAVLANVWIENHGASSAVEDWRASAIAKDGKPITGWVMPPPDRPWRFRDTVHPFMGNTYSPANSILAQTSEHAMSMYDRRYGTILILFSQPINPNSLMISAEGRTMKWYPLLNE